MSKKCEKCGDKLAKVKILGYSFYTCLKCAAKEDKKEVSNGS